MKVLFYPLINVGAIASHEVTKRGSLRIWCDYMMDCVYHGLKTVLGDDLEEGIQCPQWYDDVDKMKLYGNGFTIYGLLKRPNVIEENVIRGRLASKYYDRVIIPIHNNVYGYSLIYQAVEHVIKLGNKVSVICGNDGDYVHDAVAELCPYFKRELYRETTKNLLPISFCVPKEKVLSTVPDKEKDVSVIRPNHSGEAGWTIKTEEEYYREYASSVAAYTYKKGGWDCMRHYEILMNGCIPLFYGIESCPKNTLTTLPKKLLSDILAGNIEPSKDVIEHLLGLTRDYMTTEYLANRILQYD